MLLTLRFSARDNFGSWFIRRDRMIPFSHVEAVLPNGDTYGVRWPGGLKKRPPVKYSVVKQLSIEVPDELWAEALALEGAGYDFLGLLAFKVRIKMNESDKFFCNELWSELLKKYNVLPLEDTRIIDPHGLYLAVSSAIHAQKQLLNFLQNGGDRWATVAGL